MAAEMRVCQIGTAWLVDWRVAQDKQYLWARDQLRLSGGKDQ